MITGVGPALGSPLYRWRDAGGGWHISDVPPSEGPYETIRGGERESQERYKDAKEGSSLLEGSERAFSNNVYLPLRRLGNHFLLKVRVNDLAEGEFLLDTGASLTLISPEMARRAGIQVDQRTPVLPLKTASGIIFPPYVSVESLSLGELTLHGDGVVIHDLALGERVSGLVGMDLLSDYQVVLDTRHAVLILKPVREKEVRYGGHPRKWWRRKFAFYRYAIRIMERLMKSPEKVLKHSHLTKDRVETSLIFYRDELEALKRQAEDALVPLEWRE